MSAQRRSGRGFTLVELLVVISVIALLASITLPVTMRAAAMSRRTNCISNLSQIGAAMYLYATQWGRHFPANRPNRYNPDETRGEDDLSALNTEHYIEGLGVFNCPATTDLAETPEEIRFKRTDPDVPEEMPRPQLSYEYCGEYNPALRFSDLNTRVAWLAHDEDGRNVDMEIDGDNHRSAGANMLFADRRVEWFSPMGWARRIMRGEKEWSRVTGWSPPEE